MMKWTFGVSGAVLATAAFIAGLAGMASPAHAQTKVVVDPGKKYQVFEGWGTSLCWWAVKAGAWSEANRSSKQGKKHKDQQQNGTAPFPGLSAMGVSVPVHLPSLLSL